MIKAILQSLLGFNSQRYYLLSEMLLITNEMSRLNELEQSEKIIYLIDSRQVYMDNIDAINQEITELNNDLSPSADKLPDDLAIIWGKITELRQSGLEILEQIQELDRQQKNRLNQQLPHISKQREKLKAGRQMLTVYGKKAPLESLFIDREK